MPRLREDTEWVAYWNGRLETSQRILAGCPEMAPLVREFVEAQAAMAVEFRNRNGVAPTVVRVCPECEAFVRVCGHLRVYPDADALKSSGEDGALDSPPPVGASVDSTARAPSRGQSG